MKMTSDTFLEQRPDGACLLCLDEHLRHDAVRDHADALGIVYREVFGRTLRTKDQVLRRVAEVLGFGAYYGVNWDAMDECLCDHEFTPKAPTLLIVKEAEQVLASADAGTRKIFARILERVDAGKADSNYAQYVGPAAYYPFWIIMTFGNANSMHLWNALTVTRRAMIEQ